MCGCHFLLPFTVFTKQIKMKKKLSNEEKGEKNARSKYQTYEWKKSDESKSQNIKN